MPARKPRARLHSPTAHAHRARYVAALARAGVGSAHAHCDFIARAADVGQSQWDGRARHDPARHHDIHLVQTNEAGSIPKIQDLSHPAADGHLRRDHAPISQTGAVDFQGFAGNGRITRCNNSRGPRMEDCALALSTTRKSEQQQVLPVAGRVYKVQRSTGVPLRLGPDHR